MKLETLSAVQIGSLVNERKITPTQVVEYFLDRIHRRNPSINAFVYLMEDYARQKARELDERLNRGEYCGPFAGVPFGLKDFLPNKKGWKSSHGGVQCLISTDETDSVFCSAMEKAGGIAIGKTNAPAYGFRGTTDNRLYGPTSTPFNTAFNAGGSSGGSAAAVSDGLVPIAEGGDAGGSIRIPADFCNLYGFKAGVGTIPSVCRRDAWSATHPYCCNGGLTKTVEDAAILLQYMSALDVRDPLSLPNTRDFPGSLEQLPENIKIAWTGDFGLFETEPEVRSILENTVAKLKDAGIQIEEYHFTFPHSGDWYASQWCKGITVDPAIELNELKKRGIDLLRDFPQDFPEEFIYWKNCVDTLGIDDLYQFNCARTEVLDAFEDCFEHYHLIISPVSAVSSILNAEDKNTKGPSSVNGKPVEPLIGWTETFLANFAGYPAAAIPAGLASSGVPVGLQLTSPRHQELLLLQFSRLWEKLLPWSGFYQKALERTIPQ